MDSAAPVCRVCKDDKDVSAERLSPHVLAFKCRRCGPYRISEEALILLDHEAANSQLCAWVRSGGLKSQRNELLTTHTLAALPSVLPLPSVPARQELLLQALASQSQHPGHHVLMVYEIDFPLAWARNATELMFYLDNLHERGLIDMDKNLSTSSAYLTGKGWDHIEDRTRHPAVSNQGFIAMSFDEGLKAAWLDGIAPAIAANGYVPYRVDKRPHLDRIDAKIISEIRKSRFLVADVTLQRPGVYYEAGFAQGLGIPVIWCVREDEKDLVHFDTRQFSHSRWKETEDLKQQLTEVIGAVIGPGPETKALEQSQ